MGCIFFFFKKSSEIVFEMNAGVVNYCKIQEGIVACEWKRISGLIFASLESLNSDFCKPWELELMEILTLSFLVMGVRISAYVVMFYYEMSRQLYLTISWLRSMGSELQWLRMRYEVNFASPVVLMCVVHPMLVKDHWTYFLNLKFCCVLFLIL